MRDMEDRILRNAAEGRTDALFLEGVSDDVARHFEDRGFWFEYESFYTTIHWGPRPTPVFRAPEKKSWLQRIFGLDDHMRPNGLRNI